jgi:small subunit ribosomal protein S17
MSATTPTTSRSLGQRKIGTVVSVPGTKTVTIRVERMVSHPVYKRFVRRSKKFMAHDEQQICGVGDTVEIVECRPLSARKRWRVQRVVTRAEASLLDAGKTGKE